MSENYGWDDFCESDGNDYTVLPQGTYEFRVIGCVKGFFNGSQKMQPCNKATVEIEVNPRGTPSTKVKKDLFLNKTCERFVAQFFRSIGMKKHGEKMQMTYQYAFTKSLGQYGKCKIGNRVGIKDGKPDGNIYNEVVEFCDPSKEMEAKTEKDELAF